MLISLEGFKSSRDKKIRAFQRESPARERARECIQRKYYIRYVLVTPIHMAFDLK